MIKYRLKEEVKKYLCKTLHDIENTFGWWVNNTSVEKEALEEVPQRVELFTTMRNDKHCHYLYKVDSFWTDQEKDLCEKALNGELYTEDDMLNFSIECVREYAKLSGCEYNKVFIASRYLESYNKVKHKVKDK